MEGLRGILDLIKLFPLCLTADLCLDFLELEKIKLQFTEGRENRALVFQYLRSFLVDAYMYHWFSLRKSHSPHDALNT